jgi:hypothetical protein
MFVFPVTAFHQHFVPRKRPRNPHKAPLNILDLPPVAADLGDSDSEPLPPSDAAPVSESAPIQTAQRSQMPLMRLVSFPDADGSSQIECRRILGCLCSEQQNGTV